LPLQSGDVLNVRAGQPPVVTRAPSVAIAVPLPSVEPEPATAPVPSEAPAANTTEGRAPERSRTPQSAPSAWAELAEAGRYSEALAAANREGFARLCRSLNADGLLLLGDAARYAGSPARARQAFRSLVQRFPRDERSPDALFALGRLESEAKLPQAAAKWFERYLGLPGDPPLGEEARGRLVEIYSRMGDEDAASRAARAYLSRYPDGVHAALARKVLAEAQPASPGSQ
jgi:TolA-binding protein